MKWMIPYHTLLPKVMLVLHQRKSAFGSLLVQYRSFSWSKTLFSIVKLKFVPTRNVNPHPPRVFPTISYAVMEIHGENPTVHRLKLAAGASGFPIIGAQGSPRSAIQQRWKSSKLWTRLGRHCEQGFSILRAAWMG